MKLCVAERHREDKAFGRQKNVVRHGTMVHVLAATFVEGIWLKPSTDIIIRSGSSADVSTSTLMLADPF